MKRFIVCTCLLLVLSTVTNGQDIETTLSGNTNSQGFTVKNYAGTPLFTVRADGKIGLGILNPDALLHVAGQVKITGGSPGPGKLLTSDASGLATWTMLSSLPPSGPAGGDLLGTYPNPTIANYAVTTAKIADGAVAPIKMNYTGASSGQVIQFDGTKVIWGTPVASGFTLDQAYDCGGAGAGRTITADAGAVRIQGVDGFLVTGSTTSGTIPATSAGTRLMFYPRKSALRSGYVAGTQWDEPNIGEESCGIGVNTIASGTSAVAMGSNTTASGSRATALGHFTKAESYACTALGRYNIGGGSAGSWVPGDPIFEIGIGSNTVYTANAVTVLKNGRVGLGTAAPDATLHVEGTVKITGGSPANGKVLTSDANGLASWTSPAGNTLDEAYDEGGAGAGRTITANAGAVVIGGTDGLVVSGNFGAGSIPATGAGARMMFYPRKAAFRAGYVSGTEWDDSNISNYTTAIGYNTIARNSHSVAIGSSVEAINSNFIIGDSYTGAMRTNALTRSFKACFDNGYYLYTHSTNNVGVQIAGNGTSWSTISDSTRKDGFQRVNAEALLRRFRDLRLGSWHLKLTPEQDRHYGPMAQEWFAAFGHDGIGTIGNDTTLASADVDGVLCIAVQALEKRTAELQRKSEEISSLKATIATLEKALAQFAIQRAEVDQLKNEISTLKALLTGPSLPESVKHASLETGK